MHRHLRLAGLVLILILILGLGYWQQQSQAAGQSGGGLKRWLSPAVASRLFTSTPRPATAELLATITVTSLGDGAANATNCPGASCRLRDAIARAVDGDAINFAVTGTITLNSGQLYISKNLTISGPGATQLTISGNNTIRVFNISSGFTAALSDLTIANGYGDSDGGGGAIKNTGVLTLTNCQLLGNYTYSNGGPGGGISNYGTLTITGSTLSNNSAGNGGGIYNKGTLTLINSMLSGNSVAGSGGGINNSIDASATIRNSTLTGNTAGRFGGGVNMYFGGVTIINSTLSGNSAGDGGGGVLNWGNTGSILYLFNCTITGNSAGDSGGGAWNYGVTYYRNTIIAGNTATNSDPDVEYQIGGFTSLGHNLIGIKSDVHIFPATGDQQGTPASPINPLLAPLANYGGPTQTHALLPGSPAINAGDNCVLTNNCASDNLGFNLTTDQRGAGFNRQVGSAVDIGAFESRGFTLALASGNNQSTGVNTAFTNPLAVTVTASGAGEPVSGGQIAFTPPVSGASATLAGNPATISGSTATSGTVTANTSGGPYNVAANTKGASAAINFVLTNLITNSAPSFTPAAAIGRQQGSPAGAALTVGTIADGQTAAGSLTVMQIAGGTATGITVTGITNANGTISALVSASCTATAGTVRFQVSDGSLTGTGDLTVNITANTAPTLTYGNVSVNAGASITNSPTTATDNGSITGYAVQSQGTYTGTISVNASGVVSISNAAPVGMHTITIRATDNCGMITNAMFTLTVGNNAPTIAAGAALTRQQGTPGAVATLATVSDGETLAGNLVVAATTVPAGITVTSITNTAGAVTANVATGCNATIGANTVVLTVTDGNGGTATANLIVNVTAAPALSINTPPTDQTVCASSPATLSITAANALSYQWRKGGNPINGATASSFMIPAAAAGDAGSYDVVVTGTCGTLTATPVTLTVNPVTAITTPPASQTKPTGQSVTFSVAANGANLNYQWRKGGNPIANTTSSSFTINAVQLSDAGSYDIVVTGTCGNQTSMAALLTVNCPSITVNPPSLPNAPLGVAYSQTLTATGGTAPYSFTVTGGALPGGLQLMENGLLTGMDNAVGTFNFTVTARDVYGCTGERAYTIATNSAPTLTPVPLSRAAGSNAAPFTSANVSDVETPVNQLQFALSSDGTNFGPAATLNGVTVTLTGINAAGQVTAMVTTTCTATSTTFTLKVTDAGGTATTAPWTVTVPVNPPPVLSYTAQTVAVGQALTVNPASGPSDNGTLASLVLHGITPALGGVSVNSTTGVVTISNAAALGSYTLVIRATDNCGLTTDASFNLNTTCPTISLSPSTLPNGVQGTAYNQTLTGTPSGTTYSFAVTTGSLPPGLTLASNGALSGTPTAAGSYAFGIKATGFGACTGTQAYNLLITGTCATLTVTPATLPGGTMNTNYEQTVNVTGGTAPYSFAVTLGALPPGLSLNASTGVLTGVPTQGGTFSFRLTASSAAGDQGGCTGSRQYVMMIGCATLSFTPATLPNATRNSNYSQSLTVSPAGTYTFSLLLGSLPPGFTLSSAGVLSGMTNQTGTFNFTVKALGNTCQGTKAYSLVISSGAVALAQQADYDGDGKSDPALWSATAGVWRIFLSGRSSVQQTETPRWGTAGDVALLGDYDGDGKSDLAVFRPSDATFYIKRSSDGGFLVKPWGLATDVPVPGDYDGDGKTDIAVFRTSDGNWYVLRSSDQQPVVTAWGAGYAPYHDVAVPGDYDGDSRTDLAVFRRATGAWLVKCSSDGQILAKQWGLATDIPVAADYDGDGRTDLAVWRGAAGTWYIWQSATNDYRTANWGTITAPYYDHAVPGDYDGDSRADLAVWRAADQTWYLQCSQNGMPRTQPQGQPGDAPVSATYK